MKKALMFLCLLLMTSQVWATEKEAYYTQSGAAVLSVQSRANIRIACGKGWIEVSFLTGEAMFKDCDPSEMSKALWLGLKPYFEAWKKEICEGKK